MATRRFKQTPGHFRDVKIQDGNFKAIHGVCVDIREDTGTGTRNQKERVSTTWLRHKPLTFSPDQEGKTFEDKGFI